MSDGAARFRLAAAAVLVAVAGCHSADADRAGADARATVEPRASASASPVDAGLKPRCVLTPGPENASFEAGEELGEAIAYKGNFVIGTLRSSDGGRVAGVVQTGGPGAFSVDLGPVARDAPAPQPVARGDELFAVASLAVPGRPADGHGRARSLTLFHVKSADGVKAERLLEVTRETDVSSAYDVIAAPVEPLAKVPSTSGGLVAWDEAVGSLARSVVRVAALSQDLHAVKTTQVVASAPAPGERVDASDPRLALRDGGYWLTWMARRPEHAPSTLPLPAGEIETPSEESTYGWVEAVSLDADGLPKGSAHRLTSPTGHVGAYSIASHEGLLEVVVEEEGKGTGGGSLLHVSWRGEGNPETVTLVRGAVEEETPPTIAELTRAGSAASAVLVSYLDITGETRVVPLGAGAVPASSVEPVLRERRILGEAAGRLAVTSLRSTSGRPRWSLDWADCTR